MPDAISCICRAGWAGGGGVRDGGMEGGVEGDTEGAVSQRLP